MKTEEVKKLADDACAKLKEWQDAVDEMKRAERSLENAQGRESERRGAYQKAANLLDAALKDTMKDANTSSGVLDPESSLGRL